MSYLFKIYTIILCAYVNVRSKQNSIQLNLACKTRHSQHNRFALLKYKFMHFNLHYKIPFLHFLFVFGK